METQILEILTKDLHTRWLSTPKHVWIRGEATDDDIDAIKEAGAESQFDPLRLRSTLLADLQQGRAYLVSRQLMNKSTGTCFAHVHLILPNEVQSKDAIPWEIWAKILLLFGSPGSAAHRCQKKGPWRIILFGSLHRRKLPNPGEPVDAEHLNGGYAYPGNPRSVVIYRLEEATRVLLHELLHACGSDDFDAPVEIREVRTESWTEVFLVIVLSKGTLQTAKRLWKQQAQWIRNQEEILRNMYGVNTIDQYAWRYIVGRRNFLEGLGFQFPTLGYPNDFLRVWGPVSRFTYPLFPHPYN
jgi:hypothetical protein